MGSFRNTLWKNLFEYHLGPTLERTVMKILKEQHLEEPLGTTLGKTFGRTFTINLMKNLCSTEKPLGIIFKKNLFHHAVRAVCSLRSQYSPSLVLKWCYYIIFINVILLIVQCNARTTNRITISPMRILHNTLLLD